MPQETTANRQFEKQLALLVNKFAKHHDEYTRSDYSETEVRAEFIDPFFEALGWDLQNRAGHSPKTREVFREAGETHGRVDYVFRVDGRDVFYVEAKAPHVPLDRADVVMQAKSYAWHSRDVFIAAVTDFEEFRLYDATAKPDRKHPNAGLIFEYRYNDYLKPKTLDDLWLLSRGLVGAGSIDQLLKKSSVQARQRIPVDQAFLDDLSAWREQLAKAVFKANPDLSPADLNSIIQVFLDRLIFIRICEDRRIMDPRQLEEVARNWEFSGKRVSITNDLNALFHEVNERLNGEIFKPGHVEKIDWDINATLVVDIIKNLYFPASPYLFDRIPVELLGSIYERYLGKTIRVTETRAIVEDKPEVRKAGGVYYTPKYIVDYIVEQTVGKLIEGKTPKQIEKLRILDPACGSGSFLIGAYRKLLDYHARYYAEQAGKRADKSQPRLLDEHEDGEFKLSLEDKAAILRNNIYGVDLDPQAVEITMMSLYIKILEDARGILSGRALLPRLRDNIKCGNSLIGYDIGDLSDEDKARINPFDWNSQSEGFGEIMAAGGFDAVIANPPYRKERDSKELLRDLSQTEYGRQYYEGKMDFWYFFLHKALDVATKGAQIGFIVPSYWLKSTGSSKLIRRLAGSGSFEEVVLFGKNKVFERVSGQHVIIVFNKGNKDLPAAVQIFTSKLPSSVEIARVLNEKDESFSSIKTIRKQRIYIDDGSKIDFEREGFADLLRKIERSSIKLEDSTRAFEVSQGIVEAPDSISGNLIKRVKGNAKVGEGVFVLSRAEFAEVRFTKSETKYIKAYLRPYDVSRYHYSYSGSIVFYIGNQDNKLIVRNRSAFPNIVRHLDRYGAYITSSNAPYGIHRIRDPKFFKSEKLLCPNMFDKPCFTYCKDEFYVNFAFNVVIAGASPLSLLYLLGILNSRLGQFWFDRNSKKRGVNNDAGVAVMRQFPVRNLDLDDPADKTRHDKMVALVERMLDLHKQKQAAKSDAARERIEREIHVTDEQIDALVYELYGLTKEEIKVVEGKE